MNVGLWQRLKNYSPAELAMAALRLPGRAVDLLRLSPPDAAKLMDRIATMERDIILPIKVAGIAMLLYSFYFKAPWIGVQKLGSLEITVAATQGSFLWGYIAVNALVAVLLLNLRRVPLLLVQWAVFAMSLVDGIFVSALVVVTEGYNSILYWLFLGLVVRGAVSVPRATSQILLNLTLTVCYVMAGSINISINKALKQEAEARAVWQAPLHHLRGSNVPPGRIVSQVTNEQTAIGPESDTDRAAAAENRALGVARLREDPDDPSGENLAFYTPSDNPTQTLTLRLALLLLMTICCYGVQVLLERQRRAVEEAHEFAMREGQLRAAGRVAAEFTHQIKNPLAIINNAAFSLQRALKLGKPVPPEQVRIIQEEVEHSDRIITQIMGYAQLSEGHVERLNAVEELDHAIAQVFPPAAAYPVHIHRDYAGEFPPLFMQRRHLVDTVMNLLQNAREVLGEKGGNVFVSARCHSDSSVEVAVRDDGPGIPPEKLERIFEAYYTTKDKGTGLGLATVRHNVELYGGTVQVESSLGKGARFVLVFPAKALITLARKH